MATVNLGPDGTVESTGFTIQNSASVEAALGDTSDISGVYATSQNKYCILTLGDFGESHSSITSIRWYLRGAYTITRGGDTDIQVRIGNSSHTSSSSGTSYWDETFTLTFNAGYAPQDYYGTARTTSDGSSAWTDSDLDGLRLDINTTPEDPDVPGGPTQRANFYKAYIEVTYETATAVTDNAIFFGTNF